jgi:hypothetical protein
MKSKKATVQLAGIKPLPRALCKRLPSNLLTLLELSISLVDVVDDPGQLNTYAPHFFVSVAPKLCKRKK